MPEIAYNDREAEKMILGAIMQDADSILKAMDLMQCDDLYSSQHRLIFGACLDLYQLGEAIDLISVRDRLRAQGNEERSGGLNYLSECLDATPTVANIKLHAKLIARLSLKRQIRDWMITKQESIAVDIEPEEFLSEVATDILKLSEKVKEKKEPHASGIMHAIVKYWDRLQEKQGFIETDSKMGDAIPGYFPGHLIMIGGYTSTGKSTYLAQTLIDIGESNGRSLVFSTEDSREEKMMKLIANLSDVPQKYLLTGDIRDYQKDRVGDAMSRIKNLYKPIIYDDVYSVDEIRLKAKKHKLQDNINVVFLDYVQNLRGSGSLYERMAEAAWQLYTLGKELGVTVIVLSQVNNDSAKEESPVIGLKGAGDLASAADIILWLKRNKGYGKERELDVEIKKNRPFGTTGVIPMQFSEHYTRIEGRA